MMKKIHDLWRRHLVVGVALSLLLCRTASAQTVTDEEKLQWFLSRLVFWPLLGFCLGAAASWLWLRRVKYVPEELTIDRKVRRVFAWSLLVGCLISAVLLWADLWALYEFETTTLNMVDALKETVRGWYIVPLVSAAAFGFYLAALLFTRWPFSGRYALRPRARC